MIAAGLFLGVPPESHREHGATGLTGNRGFDPLGRRGGEGGAQAPGAGREGFVLDAALVDTKIQVLLVDDAHEIDIGASRSEVGMITYRAA